MLCISYSLLFTNLLTSLAEENKLGPPPPAGVEDNAPRPPVLYLSVALQIRNHYSEYLNLPSESQVSHKTQSYRSAEQKQNTLLTCPFLIIYLQPGFTRMWKENLSQHWKSKEELQPTKFSKSFPNQSINQSIKKTTHVLNRICLSSKVSKRWLTKDALHM